MESPFRIHREVGPGPGEGDGTSATTTPPHPSAVSRSGIAGSHAATTASVEARVSFTTPVAPSGGGIASVIGSQDNVSPAGTRLERAGEAGKKSLATKHVVGAEVAAGKGLQPVVPSQLSSRLHEFAVGDIVSVASRTWPGINKPGGMGRVQKLNPDGTYNVTYILGGSERRVPAKYVEEGSLGAGGARRIKEREFFADYDQARATGRRGRPAKESSPQKTEEDSEESAAAQGRSSSKRRDSSPVAQSRSGSASASSSSAKAESEADDGAESDAATAKSSETQPAHKGEGGQRKKKRRTAGQAGEAAKSARRQSRPAKAADSAMPLGGGKETGAAEGRQQASARSEVPQTGPGLAPVHQQPGAVPHAQPTPIPQKNSVLAYQEPSAAELRREALRREAEGDDEPTYPPYELPLPLGAEPRLPPSTGALPNAYDRVRAWRPLTVGVPQAAVQQVLDELRGLARDARGGADSSSSAGSISAASSSSLASSSLAPELAELAHTQEQARTELAFQFRAEHDRLRSRFLEELNRELAKRGQLRPGEQRLSWTPFEIAAAQLQPSWRPLTIKVSPDAQGGRLPSHHVMAEVIARFNEIKADTIARQKLESNALRLAQVSEFSDMLLRRASAVPSRTALSVLSSSFVPATPVVFPYSFSAVQHVSADRRHFAKN